MVARVLCATFVVVLALSGRVAAQVPDFAGVDEAAADAVASGEIPGIVLLVGRGDEILIHRAWGSRRLVPDAVPMTRDTIFDIASLTKPVGTTLAVLSLVERGAIKLDAPLGRYLKEFRGAAFQALDYPPGSAFQYSDTGFILLGEVVRRVSGDPLDRYLERAFFRPLGLRDTSFRPSARVRGRIAPTEYTGGRMLQGEVNDPRARLLGGVAGHAGMFSTAADLARICRMLLHGGTLGGHRFLKPETVQLMWESAPDGRGTRTLGWDLSSPYSRPMALFFPMGSVGHTGYTGTTLWIDPPSGVYLILLTNRIPPWGGGAARILELRGRVAAAVGAALFNPPEVLAQLTSGSTAADPPAPEAPARSISSPRRPACGSRRSSRPSTGSWARRSPTSPTRGTPSPGVPSGASTARRGGPRARC